MEKMEYYYFTIPRSSKLLREWETINDCILNLNNNYSSYLYLIKIFYDSETPNKVLLRFLYLTKADRKYNSIREEISKLHDLFGCKIELFPVRQRTAPKEVLNALPIAKSLMNATHHDRVY